MLSPRDLFELEGLSLAGLFAGATRVWEALDRIKSFTRELIARDGAQGAALRRLGEVLPRTVVIYRGEVREEGFELLGGDPTKGELLVRLEGRVVSDAAVVYAGVAVMDEDIHLAPGCKVEPGALLYGPSYIGPGTEVRQGAYLRGSCLIGARCVVGHTTEVKNTAMLDGAKAGHFAYLGDSILGRGVNLGAGTKLANLKIINTPFRLRVNGETILIERRKFGAILGDGCETGCNSVTNPGTILGRSSLVAPCLAVPPGFHPPKSILR